MTVSTPSPQKLLQIAQLLPASPQVLAQLNELLIDVNSGLEEIAQLLKRDAPLAARIIRISNSVAYGSAGGIASIEEAVNRVGFAEVYRLTGFAAALQMADRNLSFYGITATQLRDNTLVLALATEALARAAGVDSRTAYTAGLMRLTGKLVLDHYARTVLSTGDAFAKSGLASIVAWEQSVFGCNNAEAGATVMAGWQFPAAIAEPVRQHHLMQPAIGPHSRTAYLLNLAGGIATTLGYGLPGEEEHWELTPVKLRAASVTETHVKRCADDTQAAFEAIRHSLD